MSSRPLVGLALVVAVAALVGSCTGAVVSTTAGWVIGPLVALTMLPVVLRRGGDDEEEGAAGAGSGQRPGRVPDDAEPEWAADRLDDVPRPGDWDGSAGAERADGRDDPFGPGGPFGRPEPGNDRT